MNRLLKLSLLLLYCSTAYSQQNEPRNFFLRFYADNDALVPSNNATDWGYTSGIRIDLFSQVTKNQGFLRGLNNLAGENSNIYRGWGIMQTVIAPKRTSLIIPDKNDYPYSGALFAIYTVHSGNEEKRLNLYSEWIAGLMGPPSFAKQTQVFFHRLIKDPKPMGWDYQLPTDLLLNYNFKAEKQLGRSKNISLLANGEMRLGSMNDGISAGIRLQLANNKDYFSGLATQLFAENKPRLSLSLQASADITVYNALLQGGLINSISPLRDSHSKWGSDRELKRLTGNLDIFLLFSLKKLSVSARQKFTTSEFKSYGAHTFGNISIYTGL